MCKHLFVSKSSFSSWQHTSLDSLAEMFTIYTGSWLYVRCNCFIIYIYTITILGMRLFHKQYIRTVQEKMYEICRICISARWESWNSCGCSNQIFLNSKIPLFPTVPIKEWLSTCKCSSSSFSASGELYLFFPTPTAFYSECVLAMLSFELVRFLDRFSLI